LKINGWTILADVCFLEQYEALASQVKRLQHKYPESWMTRNQSKRLAAIIRLISVEIVEDPTREIYRQGKTLGEEHKHWFRAKFYQQYRLFFRYHLERKIIIYGWVNDSSTKRAYDSKSDAYRVFEKMLKEGHPPNDWEQLLLAAQAENERFEKLIEPLEQED